ncbi:MAG: hypothetical protein JWQ55_6382 [Rhodopila sp.]|nr:hypothetical protein [Rhodopila sp.]
MHLDRQFFEFVKLQLTLSHRKLVAVGGRARLTALLHGSTRRRPYLSSFDPDGDRASQLLHLVRDMNGDANFGGTTPVLAEA